VTTPPVTTPPVTTPPVTTPPVTTPPGTVIEYYPFTKQLEKAQGLFNSYVYEENDFFLDYQFIYNLKTSQDFASLITNKKAIHEKNRSPSIEYYHEFQEEFSKHELNKDKTAFEAFRDVSVLVLTNFIPLTSAMAKDEKGEKKQKVDSNAAKAFKDDEAKGINLMGLGAGLVIGAAAGKFLGKKLVTPKTRALFAGVMTGWTIIMAMHAGKQAKASTERAELLRKMQAEFDSASGAINSCGPEGCKELSAGVKPKPKPPTTPPPGNTDVCINQQRQSDPNCTCRINNTCMRMGVNGFKGINPGTFKMMSSSVDPINELSNGKGANLNLDRMANNAAKLQKLAKQLEGEKQLKDAFKNKKKAELQLKNDLQRLSSSLPASSRGFGGISGMPSNPAEAAKMLEDELENTPKSIQSPGEGLSPPSSNKNEDDKLDFGLKDGNSTDDKLSEAMQDNLDYGSNDISDTNASLFDLVSNRYRKSGMRRLFYEGDLTPQAPSDESVNVQSNDGP